MIGDGRGQRRRQVVIAAASVPLILGAGYLAARYARGRVQEGVQRAVAEKVEGVAGPITGAAAIGGMWLLWRMSARG